MRAARLHGIRDLRVEKLAAPEPGVGELLVRIEACGICPTDVRKYLLGVNDGNYPFNPGHEWLGRVEAVGDGVIGWTQGDRVYGDTYGGYSELATLPVAPGPWSHGPLAVPGDLPAERAVFVEPLADCLHAVHDQARIAPGDDVVVVGGGQMGLQLVLAASLAGARALCVEPLGDRRELALALGAAGALDPSRWTPSGDAAAVILSIGTPSLVDACIRAVRPGGRVVLFAGFGDEGLAAVDLNALHYREVALVGSEWIGTPPNQRRERYEEALELLVSGRAPLERLVTARCGFAGLASAFADQQARRGLKTILVPDGR
jgi:(R,R)-butanediol dehydrogenase/meso-butanediol dehydrogenase/diacetyl reductase